MESEAFVENTWSEIIEPKSKWFDIDFRELWNYRDLILIFVKRDMISIYKQTVLGPVWFLLGPLFTVFTFTFVFSKIAGISTDGVPAPLFYIAGTTLWNYFQTCFTATAGTFVANAGIFGKVYFPRLTAPIAVILSSLFKFGFQMLVFLSFWAYYVWHGQVHPNLYVLLFPFLVLLMAGMSLGLGIIISALTTKYRDLNFFIGFGITILMYASPVIYPMSSVPASYKPFLEWNPIVPIIEAFRFGFMSAGAISLHGLLYSTIFTVIALTLGILLFNRVEKTFMDTV